MLAQLKEKQLRNFKKTLQKELMQCSDKLKFVNTSLINVKKFKNIIGMLFRSVDKKRQPLYCVHKVIHLRLPTLAGILV